MIWFFRFTYFEHGSCILYLMFLPICRHVPICFFLLFFCAPMPGKTGGQILLSMESLVLAHLIWSVIELIFHFPIWLLQLFKAPMCTRLCWLFCDFLIISLCTECSVCREICATMQNTFLCWRVNPSLWETLFAITSSFPQKLPFNSPCIWISHSLHPASSSAWQSSNSLSSLISTNAVSKDV